MDEEFTEALKKVIRDQLISKNTVVIDKLGSFIPVHLPQRKWEYKDGQIVILPPEDYVEFNPDLTTESDNGT